MVYCLLKTRRRVGNGSENGDDLKYNQQIHLPQDFKPFGTCMPLLNDDRLLPANPETRAIARALYTSVKDLPIISPHGHTDPAWFALNEPFSDAANLLVIPDHYVFRMLYSQGISMESLGIPSQDGTEVETEPRRIWQLFADNYRLFAGTPSRTWLDHVFQEVFGFEERLDGSNADDFFDRIGEALAKPEFRPRALFERYNIEVIATTESPLDDLRYHEIIQNDDWKGRVVTAYRPDPVVDPEYEGFQENLDQLGALTGCDTRSWPGYLEALRRRREYFIQFGATSTDHGHPTAATRHLSMVERDRLFQKIVSGSFTPAQAEDFRGQMLLEMAKMSLEDGLVMQIHPGSYRNHNQFVFNRFGRDKGADIPTRTSYVDQLKPLLDQLGNEPQLSIILFTLDESSYSRELAPLAGHYPTLKLGPPWWFHDSPEGMRRFRRQAIETAGFYNTVGFNDDTRAFLSIPARHDVARRIDCGMLAEWVAEHTLSEDEAFDLAKMLAYDFAKSSYKL
jgi:glucuronate isomerase